MIIYNSKIELHFQKIIAVILIISFAGFLSLFSPSKVFAATGDITAVRIINDTCTAGTSCNGWVAEIDITGLSTGGTYDFGLGANNDPTNAKIVFTVTSLGYDTSGNATTITRTIYGTKQLRKPYPNEAVVDEVESGGTLTVRVSLSDFIYSGDTSITANIGTGFYTGSNAVSEISVTNNSILTYPKSVGRWAWPGYERVTEDFLLESVVFNRFAQNGKPLAAVKYTCTDQNSHTVTATVNDMTISTRTGDANTVLVYAATIPVATLTQGDVITCNFTAYPWVGNSGSLLNSDLVANGGDGFAQPDERLGPLYEINDKSGTYGQSFAVVDPVNGQASALATWVTATQSAAETAYTTSSANSYTTIGYAAQALKAYNLANYGSGRNEPGGGVILLVTGNHNYSATTPASDLGTMNLWLTITRLSSITQSDAVINTGGASIKTQKVKLSGITLNSATLRAIRGNSNVTDIIWADNNLINLTSAGFFSWHLGYATHNTVTSLNLGFVTNASREPWALIRGNTGPAISGVKSNMYTTIGNTNVYSGSNGFVNDADTYGEATSDNSIWAFNKSLKYSVGGTMMNIASASTINSGIAIVQNVFEKIVGTSAELEIAADSSTGTPVNNVIMFHNTVAGERVNLGYNDTGTSALYRTNFVNKYNIFRNWNNKDDTFGTPNAARTGSWTVGHNVGTYGINSGGSLIGWEFNGLNSVISETYGYNDDQSYKGALGAAGTPGSGNGNYHLTSSASALNLIPSGKAVLPYDLDGNARHNNGFGAAGAYEWDVIAPTVTGFSIPTTASSLTVSVDTFTATDAVGVTGYKLTESSSAPAYDAAGWTGSAPANYVFSTAGAKTLYAWAKDAVGNVSTSASDTVTITLPTYTIGGTTSGLTGTVILQNNAGDNESVSTGSFTFDTALADSAVYAVTVLTQPSGQTCTVSSGSGTVASANVTNVSVSCSNTAKAITVFDFNGLSPAVVGSVNEGAKTIALTVPYGTAVTALVPTITHTGASVSPASGVAGNFTTPQTYTVTAADASTQAYVVTVTVAANTAKAITVFDFNGLSPAVVGTVNEGAKTIALTVPYGTAVTALVPTITHTGASVSPASGVAGNFTTPQTYTVTAADASTQAYVVTVTVAANDDSTAPIRSAGSPSGSQSAGTTQVTLSLTTNENATCKYSTTADTAYDSMTSEFSTTGGTSHSSTISGLSNGNSYNYYVRCTDGTNINSDDYTISFSVASPASSGGGGGSRNTRVTTVITNSSTSTTPSLCTPFISPFLRSLTLGSTGNDVKALQVFLNGKGYTIAYAGPGSKGNESTYFGPATTKALSRFQSVNNIYPALGYFGTLTMAKVKALSSTTACTSTSTPVITLPTNTTKFYFTRSLALGSTGTDVKQLQIFLNSYDNDIYESI